MNTNTENTNFTNWEEKTVDFYAVDSHQVQAQEVVFEIVLNLQLSSSQNCYQ